MTHTTSSEQVYHCDTCEKAHAPGACREGLGSAQNNDLSGAREGSTLWHRNVTAAANEAAIAGSLYRKQ